MASTIVRAIIVRHGLWRRLIRFPSNPALAQQQANQLNGNATRSLQQFKGNLVHAIWFFARAKGALPARASTARAAKARTHEINARGHKRAGTR